MALSESKVPVTGNPGGDPPDRAKYGVERRGDEAEAARRANELNNAEPGFYEAVDGRCPVDGLPAGNCAHLPGAQLVIDPETGESVYEPGYAQVAAGPDYPANGKDKQETGAAQEKAGREGRDAKK